MITITKIELDTPSFNPALGQSYTTELSNGDRLYFYEEEFINWYCYKDGKYDEEKIERLKANNYQELIGEKYCD